MVLRAAMCRRPRDRLSSPSSVMYEQLIIRVNETSHSYYFNLRVEVKSDDMERYKMHKTL